jgi:hypothetical protein
MPAPADWSGAWESALAELELDVARAERLLAGPDPDLLAAADAARWSPPVLGPLPEHLGVRARTLLQRQLDVTRALAQAATATRRQLALLDRVEGGQSPRRPVYVDAAL